MEAYWCSACDTPTTAPQVEPGGKLVCPDCESEDLGRLVLAPAQPPLTVKIDRADVFPDDTPEGIERTTNEIGQKVGLRFALMLAGMTIIARYTIWHIEVANDEEYDLLIDLGGTPV